MYRGDFPKFLVIHHVCTFFECIQIFDESAMISYVTDRTDTRLLKYQNRSNEDIDAIITLETDDRRSYDIKCPVIHPLTETAEKLCFFSKLLTHVSTDSVRWDRVRCSLAIAGPGSDAPRVSNRIQIRNIPPRDRDARGLCLHARRTRILRDATDHCALANSKRLDDSYEPIDTPRWNFDEF